jgi:hypothetical protein
MRGPRGRPTSTATIATAEDRHDSMFRARSTSRAAVSPPEADPIVAERETGLA